MRNVLSRSHPCSSKIVLKRAALKKNIKYNKKHWQLVSVHRRGFQLGTLGPSPGHPGAVASSWQLGDLASWRVPKDPSKELLPASRSSGGAERTSPPAGETAES